MKYGIVAILIYDGCSFVSIQNHFRKLNVKSVVIKLGDLSLKSQDLVSDVDGFIIPGGSSINALMIHIDVIRELVNHVVKTKKRLLGICLGMQVFCKATEEGGDDLVSHFPFVFTKRASLNIGFAELSHSKQSTRQFFGDDFNFDDAKFYFLHGYASYLSGIENRRKAICWSDGMVTCIRSGSVVGCQFHPELSGSSGLLFLKWWLACHAD